MKVYSRGNITAKQKTPARERILTAALALITRRGGADVTMAQIARAARLSRQAVYLHFADRAELLLALVAFIDEKRGLIDELQKIFRAPTGVEAMRGMVSLQVRSNPNIWAAARAIDAVRRTDPAAERSWQDRLKDRLQGCRQIVDRISKDGDLRAGLDPDAAADLLWTITSLRMWEDLVLQRGWAPEKYEALVMDLLLRALTDRNISATGTAATTPVLYST